MADERKLSLLLLTLQRNVVTALGIAAVVGVVLALINHGNRPEPP